MSTTTDAPPTDNTPPAATPSTDPEPGLVVALAEAMLHSADVVKTAVNKDQGYKYASVDSILSAVRGPLLERSIILTVEPVAFEVTEIASKSGTKGTGVVAIVDFTFRHGPSGETLPITGWRGLAQDYGDKAYNKAYTSAVKTFVLAQWLLPTETDESAPPEQATTAALPSWAKDIGAGPKADTFLADLRALVGDDQALAIVESGAKAYGGIPRVAADLVGALRAIVAPSAKGTASAPVDAKAPCPVPAETTAALGEHEKWARNVHLDVLQGVATAPDGLPARVAAAKAEIKRRAAEVPLGAPGTIEHPRMVDASSVQDCARILKAAGCICHDPVKAEDQELARNPACPIKGHGGTTATGEEAKP